MSLSNLPTFNTRLYVNLQQTDEAQTPGTLSIYKEYRGLELLDFCRNKVNISNQKEMFETRSLESDPDRHIVNWDINFRKGYGIIELRDENFTDRISWLNRFEEYESQGWQLELASSSAVPGALKAKYSYED